MNNNLTINKSTIMFGTKGLDTQEKSSFGTSKYITYGNQILKITDIVIKNSQKGNKRLQFEMESEKVTTEGFVPEEGAEGKVGRVAMPKFYLDLTNTAYLKKFNTDIGIIADKLGVRAELDAITVTGDDDVSKLFDSYVAAITPLLVNKFAWWAISGSEYQKSDGSGIAVSLSVRKFLFIASLEEGESHLKEFDVTKGYNYEKLPTGEKITNKLPF